MLTGTAKEHKETGASAAAHLPFQLTDHLIRCGPSDLRPFSIDGCLDPLSEIMPCCKLHMLTSHHHCVLDIRWRLFDWGH